MKIIQKEVKDFAKKPIVDIEISNDIRGPNGGAWKYINSNVIVVGTFYKNKITQFILKENKESFINKVVEHLINLSKEGELYCLNERMEREGLFNLTNKIFPFKDVRKSIVPGSSKERLFSFLIKAKKLEPITDPFNGDGYMCILKYKEYEKTKDESFLLEIATHNQNCLLKENQIFKHRGFLSKFF